MKYRLLMLMAAIPCVGLARDIPVTRTVLSSQVDLIVAGTVVKVYRVGDNYAVRISVDEELMDRNNQVSEFAVLNAYGDRGMDAIRVNGKYVFVASTCATGAHVVLGPLFVAKVVGDRIDTTRWPGFGASTSFDALRIVVQRPATKDSFLTMQVCDAIFQCARSPSIKDRDVP